MADSPDSQHSRRERLNLLLRQRQGEPRRAALRDTLRDATGHWRLLDLAESDRLAERIRTTIVNARSIGATNVASELNRDEVSSQAEHFFSHLPGEALILTALTDVSRTGILETDYSSFTGLVHKLIDFDKDSIIATTEDLHSGVVIQKIERGNQYEYETEFWHIEDST